jgi:hypothetical protein
MSIPEDAGKESMDDIDDRGDDPAALQGRRLDEGAARELLARSHPLFDPGIESLLEQNEMDASARGLADRRLLVVFPRVSDREAHAPYASEPGRFSHAAVFASRQALVADLHLYLSGGPAQERVPDPDGSDNYHSRAIDEEIWDDEALPTTFAEARLVPDGLAPALVAGSSPLHDEQIESLLERTGLPAIARVLPDSRLLFVYHRPGVPDPFASDPPQFDHAAIFDSRQSLLFGLGVQLKLNNPGLMTEDDQAVLDPYGYESEAWQGQTVPKPDARKLAAESHPLADEEVASLMALLRERWGSGGGEVVWPSARGLTDGRVLLFVPYKDAEGDPFDSYPSRAPRFSSAAVYASRKALAADLNLHLKHAEREEYQDRRRDDEEGAHDYDPPPSFFEIDPWWGVVQPYGADFPRHAPELAQRLAEELRMWNVAALDYREERLYQVEAAVVEHGSGVCLNPSVWLSLIAYLGEYIVRRAGDAGARWEMRLVPPPVPHPSAGATEVWQPFIVRAGDETDRTVFARSIFSDLHTALVYKPPPEYPFADLVEDEVERLRRGGA